MKRSNFPLLFALLVTFSLSVSSPLHTTAAQPNYRILGHYGGRCMGVAVQGDYAYVLEGYHLITLDITNPAVPQVTSRATLPQFPHDIKVSGNRLVVNCWRGYQIFDITRPDAPVGAGSGSDSFMYWDLSGQLIYVVDGVAKSVKIIDVSDPARPGVRARYDWDSKLFTQIDTFTVTGGIAYLHCIQTSVWPYKTYLVALDVSNPDIIQFLGSFQDPAAKNGLLFISDHMAYQLSGKGFEVYDLNSPTSPTLVGSAPRPSHGYVSLPCQLLTSGTRAYVLYREYCMDGDLIASQVQVLDISDPLHPVEKLFLDQYGSLTNLLAVKDNTLFLANYSKGLDILNISDPTTATLLATFQTLRESRAVALNGRRAYIMDQDDLRVLDVSNPEQVTPAGSAVHIPGLFGSLQAHGTALYNFNTTSGLSIIDISRPDAPVLASRIKTPGAACDMALDGHYAYIADGDSLRIIDVADPAHPKLLSLTGTALNAQKSFQGIAVKDGRAYLSDSASGLVIFDVQNPTAPYLLARIGIPNLTGWCDVAVWNNLVALGCDNRYLALVDTSNLSHPVILKQPDAHSIPPSFQSDDMLADQGLLFYKRLFSLGFYAVDLRQPVGNNPVFGFSGPTWHSSDVLDFKVNGSQCVLAQRSDGITILAFSNPYHPTAAQPVWARYE